MARPERVAVPVPGGRGAPGRAAVSVGGGVPGLGGDDALRADALDHDEGNVRRGTRAVLRSQRAQRMQLAPGAAEHDEALGELPRRGPALVVAPDLEGGYLLATAEVAVDRAERGHLKRPVPAVTDPGQALVQPDHALD